MAKKMDLQEVVWMALTKIISGGQTGADQGGLEAGRELELQTGGTAPLGWMTERGSMKELLQSYGLVEAGVPTYPFRTKMNVLNSDATVIFGNINEPGSHLTRSLCVKHGKPCAMISMESLTEALRSKTVLEAYQSELNSHMISEARAERWGTINSLYDFLRHNNVRVLNVAGNRESKNPGIQERVRKFMVQEYRRRNLECLP